jgi:hypothetical protein
MTIGSMEWMRNGSMTAPNEGSVNHPSTFNR